jgi:hypothetical protein
MLDIEGSTWNYTQSENLDYVLALRSAVEKFGLNVTIYCTQWVEFFGSEFTAFRDVPLIYAVRFFVFLRKSLTLPLIYPKLHTFVHFPLTQHYDLVPSYYDYIEHPYGGWAVRF